MGLADITRRALTPRTSARITATTTVAVWWGTAQIAAATVATDGASSPVLFGSWPVLSTAGRTDADVFIQLTAAIGAPARTGRLVAALPSGWGPARRAAWHRAANAAGYTDTTIIPAAEVLTATSGPNAPVAVELLWIAVTADVDNLGVIACRTGADGRTEILADHSNPRDQAAVADGVPRMIVDVLTAAEVPGPPARIIVAGVPEATRRLAAELPEVTDADIVTVTPIDLARTVAATAVTGQALPPEPVPGPPRAGIIATVACGVVGILLAAWVIADTLTGYTPTGDAVAVFSPGHLAIAAFTLATTGVAAGMLIVHAHLAATGTWSWATAGIWLIAGAAAGLAAAGTAGLSLAAVHAVPAGVPLAWAVLPSIPFLAACAGIGLLLRSADDDAAPAPTRQIWPPIGAVTLAVIGVMVVRSAEPIWANMPTSAAFTARAGLVVIATATAWAATSKPPVAIGIVVVLAIAYTLTASPATGTLACLLVIGAATIRAGTALAYLARDRHISRTPRSLLAGHTRLAPRT